jgi:hypothetical protein
VNAVCPGIIETPMMDRFSGGTAEGRARVIAQEPVGRMGTPEEIAQGVTLACAIYKIPPNCRGGRAAQRKLYGFLISCKKPKVFGRLQSTRLLTKSHRSARSHSDPFRTSPLCGVHGLSACQRVSAPFGNRENGTIQAALPREAPTKSRSILNSAGLDWEPVGVAGAERRVKCRREYPRTATDPLKLGQ